MRITFVTIVTAFIYVLFGSLISNVPITIAHIALSFVYSLFLVFFIACFYHFLLFIVGRLKLNPSLLLIVMIFFIAQLFIYFGIHIPDFIRHQTKDGYTRYESLFHYVNVELLEGIYTALFFSIIIPLLDLFIKRKINKDKQAS